MDRLLRALRRNAPWALVLAVGACSGGSGLERGVDQFSSSLKYTLDGAVSDSRTLEAPYDGVLDLVVDSLAGDVVIRGGQKTDGKILVNVSVRARHGSQRLEEASASLDKVSVTADMQRGGDVPALAVTATSTSTEPWLHRADIEVLVPEFRRATVRTRQGKVFVFENRGGVSVNTTDGEIRVITPWAITENVTLITRGANIVYRVNVGSCGLFDVDVVNGSVQARVEAGDWRILDPRNDQDTLYAQLGTCPNKILMRSSDGRVIVSVVKDPLSHGSLFLAP